jgi:hypothetical protein
MKKIIELLCRWYKKTKKLNHAIDILPISIDTMDIANMLVYDYVRETHTICNDHILTSIGEQLKYIILNGGLVSVAYIGNTAVGIVCSLITVPEIWDLRQTATVSNLYVKPEHRTNPRILMGLINNAMGFIISNKADVIKVSCDSKEIADKYIKLFGFNPIYHQVVMEAK